MSSARVAAAVAAVAFAIYGLTAARTITFWESAHYSLLARTLSITNPPGSLLLTLIGRVLGDLPFAWPVAFRLNLIAALIGATTAALVVWLGIRIASARAGTPDAGARAGGIVAGLTWAFAVTPWTYATQFNPYALSALFTAWILAAFLKWWHHAEDADAVGAAALVALLLGVDISVHRANLLLVPALALGLVLRRPRALHLRFVAAIAIAFVAGAKLQLLYIPLARRDPFLDVADPDRSSGSGARPTRSDRRRILGESLAAPGRLRERPARRPRAVRARESGLRRPDAVDHGDADRARMGDAAASSAAPRDHGARPGTRQRTRRRRVFNRPETYFRPLDRHYLPFLVTLMPPLAAGVSAVVGFVTTRAGRLAGAAAALLALAMPL